MKVADLMASHVEFIEANATVQEAAALMGELDISALPVGTPDDLQGVITDRDILFRLVAEGRDPRRTRVTQIATKRVFSCRPDDPIRVALDLMAAQNLRRVPVLDEGGRVVGWLTLSDLSRRLLVENDVVQKALHDVTEADKRERPER